MDCGSAALALADILRTRSACSGALYGARTGQVDLANRCKSGNLTTPHSASEHGFYPAGGGRFATTIEPCERLSSIRLLERGEIERRSAVAIVANLPRSIAQRETDTIKKLLNWDAQATEIVETRNSVSPGNIVLIELASSNVTEVFCGFGRIGASAESVASEAADAVRSYLVSGAVAGQHLTDQLLLPFALAGGGTFTAEKLNLHSRTNVEIIRCFLPVRFHDNRTRTLYNR
jgi:RNA 3'-terminal phosphate cyclase (ATP)